ncbi:hypothetical protein CC1G_12408 [Coprinopsis cinerea okayama7|uniref:Uncharacterized protein n=1 Tax=Coprinopsis cinerea (strain Okayama-7 / 130 / ATCC MYA-4618 / FGSC 9003) TaxID=240176 RepID=A8P367_COPC7|nr:hypothetical protein CC1G_12408 [Coprinopsis cinerea okayama7\|eukprot:XP_001838484.2 hypothetical protein CC1G_12408 [Coprinopsis cinerea okayama7\
MKGHWRSLMYKPERSGGVLKSAASFPQKKESREPQKFKVFWKDRAFEKETHGGTEGELLLDGRPCGSCFIIPGKRHQTQDIAWVDGFENEGGEVQPFAFVKAERTEDEEWLVWKELDEHIGEIRVIIRKIKGATSKDPSLRGLNAKEKRQRLQERKERQEMSSRTLVPNIGGKIHEQVKKELHGVRIGYDDS